MTGKKIIGRVYNDLPSFKHNAQGGTELTIGVIHNESTRSPGASKMNRKPIIGRVQNELPTHGASKKSNVTGRVENELNDKRNPNQ